VRTYARQGQTPTLRVPRTRDHLSAIGAVPADGRVVLQVQTAAVRGPRVVRCLRQRLRHIPGKLLVIGDGAPIHRAQVGTALLAEGGAQRRWLEQLPGDAPDVNPLEGIGHYLKRVAW
jgi:hypothetical protein